MKNKEIEDLEVDIDGGDDDMLDDPEAAEQNKKAMEAEARRSSCAKKREEEEYRKLEAKFEELGVENEDAKGFFKRR